MPSELASLVRHLPKCMGELPAQSLQLSSFHTAEWLSSAHENQGNKDGALSAEVAIQRILIS